MRKFFSISVVGLMLTSVGIALAQTPPVLSTMEKMQKVMAGPQCTTSDKAVYGPDAVTQHEGMSFRCAYVYDEWLTRTNRVVWVRVKP
jgi:hypothetical protein